MSPIHEWLACRRDPSCYLKSLSKIDGLRLHEKKASPPRRDLAIVYPRSRLVGLEISHIDATEGSALLVG